jgi:phosphoglycolate phosphatase-like HAD superfamily hydrolase
MRKLNIQEPDKIIKVGDSTIDIEEGKNAGCKYNIGVTTGAHSKQQLKTANPDYIFDNIYDLMLVIQ